MFKDFIHVFLLSCEKATFLIEKELDDKLSFIERLQLKVHLSICKLCHAYHQKVRFMDKAMRKLADKENNTNYFSEEEIEVQKKKLNDKINEVKD
jgi:predicted anti-sigma-YlaC factor YlaD